VRAAASEDDTDTQCRCSRSSRSSVARCLPPAPPGPPGAAAAAALLIDETKHDSGFTMWQHLSPLSIGLNTQAVYKRYLAIDLARDRPPTQSHRILSYRIVSYRIVSYRIVSYRIVSYRIVSYRIESYRIVSYQSDMGW